MSFDLRGQKKAAHHKHHSHKQLDTEGPTAVCLQTECRRGGMAEHVCDRTKESCAPCFVQAKDGLADCYEYNADGVCPFDDSTDCPLDLESWGLGFDLRPLNKAAHHHKHHNHNHHHSHKKAAPVVPEEEICFAKVCNRGGMLEHKCDRTDGSCAPCYVWNKGDDGVDCYEYNADGECPFDDARDCGEYRDELQKAAKKPKVHAIDMTDDERWALCAAPKCHVGGFADWCDRNDDSISCPRCLLVNANGDVDCYDLDPKTGKCPFGAKTLNDQIDCGDEE